MKTIQTNTKQLKAKGTAFLKWAGKINIGLLTLALKNRNWIQSQCEFAKLFDNIDINHKVHCNMKYIYETAYLLYRLKQNNFFYTVYSKGYFTIAEQHILDYSGKSLPKNMLKNISSKIRRNPIKYHVIIKEVEMILNEITHCSKKLLRSY